MHPRQRTFLDEYHKRMGKPSAKLNYWLNRQQFYRIMKGVLKRFFNRKAFYW